MAEVKVVYDREGETLTVWFADPHQESVCEETGDEIVLMKDDAGRVIGVEKLNFSVDQYDPLRVAFEATPVSTVRDKRAGSPSSVPRNPGRPRPGREPKPGGLLTRPYPITVFSLVSFHLCLSVSIRG